jgi:hypothetical protein
VLRYIHWASELDCGHFAIGEDETSRPQQSKFSGHKQGFDDWTMDLSNLATWPAISNPRGQGGIQIARVSFRGDMWLALIGQVTD